MSQSNRTYDVVVVGSGFGGSINALRLAEAGKSVLVLERGRRYRPGEFPRDVTAIDRLLWGYPRRPRRQGLYDVRFMSSISTIAASGVGGGSLIYANIHIRPDADVFEGSGWPSWYSRVRLDPYYDKVARTLSVTPLPEDISLPKRDRFRDAGRRLGMDTFDPDQAVLWKAPAPEGRTSCCLCAECEFGCQFGAKSTLDLTYLQQAAKLGAEVLPQAYVTHVEPSNGTYRVHYREVDTGTPRTVSGARLVLSAGTLGTTEILLRSRDVTRTLPGLSARLGHGFSGNGDFLGSLQNCRDTFEPWRGPDVTSVIRFHDAHPHFTMAAPTFNAPVMAVLASLGQPSQHWIDPLLAHLWPTLDRALPWLLRKGHLNQPVKLKLPNAGEPGRMTNLFAIGRDNANGILRLRRGHLDIAWDYARENEMLVRRIIEGMRAVADVYGGTFAPLVTWTVFRRIVTVHPLGGCHLSAGPETGVVSPEGEVHGYPGLFVADGSVIPSSIGFHPAMTIAAVSERIAEAVTASFPS